MSIQSVSTTNRPLGASALFEAHGPLAAVSRKPWATPTVIKGEMDDAENGK
jgi:hypothetical protein